LLHIEWVPSVCYASGNVKCGERFQLGIPCALATTWPIPAPAPATLCSGYCSMDCIIGLSEYLMIHIKKDPPCPSCYSPSPSPWILRKANPPPLLAYPSTVQIACTPLHSLRRVHPLYPLPHLTGCFLFHSVRLILPISSPVLAIALDPPNPISCWTMVSNRDYSPLPHRKRTLVFPLRLCPCYFIFFLTVPIELQPAPAISYGSP